MLKDDEITIQSFNAQEMITKESENIESIYIVVSGKAKITRLASNGEHHILCYYVSDGILGELELLTDSNVATTSSIAISNVTCIEISYKTLAYHLKHNTEFLRALSLALAYKVKDNSEGLLSFAMESGESRLAAYIIKGAYKNVFFDNLSDVSRSIGISYRHLFRLLQKFSDDKILEKTEEGYLIVDLKALKAKTT